MTGVSELRSVSASFTHRGYSFTIEALSAGERIGGRMVGPVPLILEGRRFKYGMSVG